MLNAEPKIVWLDADWTLSQFGQNRTIAIAVYQQFVMQGKGLPDPKEKTKCQIDVSR
ncbi:MAG: hypothetical protein ACKE51_06090 [Methylococcaceae bacterium]